MKFTDLFSMIWQNMWRRKARTILTMVGVLIGSSAILTMVSIGSGFQESMMKSMGSLQNANTITIMSPAYFQSMGIYQTEDSKKVKKLDDKSVKDIEKLSNVKYVTPKVSGQYNVTYKKNQIFSAVNGVTPKSTEDKKYIYGRSLSNGSGKEAVIGFRLASYLLDSSSINNVDKNKLQEILRKKITLNLTRTGENGEEEQNNINLRVVGIMDENGADDFSIITNLSLMDDLLDWTNSQENYSKKNGYQQMDVVTETAEQVDTVEKELKDKGYTTSTIKEAINIIDSTLNGVKVAVGAIGAISLIVAAFGIMNTMNMSIYERTREIGIMKVVGASLSDVKKIFVVEAAAIGFIGGLAGVLLGLTINLIVNSVSKAFMSAQGLGSDSKLAVAHFSLILFVLAFSTLIGLLSGLYPASRASKLNVINALKVE